MTQKQLPAKPATPEARARFLGALAASGLICQASKLSGASYQSLLRARKADEEFEAEVQTALSLYGETLQKEAHRRAVDGVEEPVYYKGKVVGHVRRYSDRMLELCLKARVPQFRERATVDHNVRGGVLVVGLAPKTVDEWAAAHEEGPVIDVKPEKEDQ